MRGRNLPLEILVGLARRITGILIGGLVLVLEHSIIRYGVDRFPRGIGIAGILCIGTIQHPVLRIAILIRCVIITRGYLVAVYADGLGGMHDDIGRAVL